MRILATERFLEAAREEPAPLQEVAGGPADGAPRARLMPSDRILGVSREPEQLKLWYYVPRGAIPRAPAPPLAHLARSELLDLGVPPASVAPIQSARALDQLDALGLPAELADRLRFQFIQLATGLRADDGDLVRRAGGLDELRAVLSGRITDLLLNLDSTQERIVNLSRGGVIVVRGVAGSGKTSVALHRIHRLVSRGDLFGSPRVLLLTFNRSLASAARELLARLGVRAAQGVEVSTLHAWCLRFSGIRPRRIMSAERRRRMSGVLESEFHFIKGRLIRTLPQYLAAEGAGVRRPGREAVWEAYEAYRRACAAERRSDWDDPIEAAHDKLNRLGDDAPAYDFVFVDEAQDLTVAALKTAARLAREPGELFAAYDPAQSIYERGFRWKDAGITVHGARSVPLTRSFRSTRAILDAARAVLDGVRRRASEEILAPDSVARDGAAPRHVRCDRFGEADAIAAEIRRLLETGAVRPGNIGVLAYPNKVKRAVAARLRERGLICQEHGHESEIRLSDPSVKVLPMKSSKGLEFPVVFVVASGRHFRNPRGETDEGWTDEMRRVFYVAMTRAMSELVLVYEERDPPPFLDS